MKNFVSIAVVWAILFTIAGATSASGQGGEGYTIVSGERGPLVCIGKWIPPTDVALPGVCEGELIGLSQLTAVSSSQSAEQLDRLASLLASIDQRLALNNDRLSRLIEAEAAARTAMDQQVRRTGESLSDSINKRFNAMPDELLNNERFRKELTKLKEDILDEVEKRSSTRKKTSPK